MDSLKALDPNWPIREADIYQRPIAPVPETGAGLWVS